MAEMRFLLYDTEGKTCTAEELISYELTRETAAPCDGLRLSFIRSGPLGEIDRVEAYRGGEKCFSGYADTQREERTERGNTVMLYARSSACLLVDNEAQPGDYYMPTAVSMFHLQAKGLGFTQNLPDCCAEGVYTVRKGTSCYGAINGLIYSVTGKKLCVTPDNVLAVKSGGVCRIPEDNVISEQKSINRGLLLSRIDCKREDTQGYTYHYESRALYDHGIRRSRKVRLSSLPEWQRNASLKQQLAAAAEDYKVYKITVCGAGSGELFDTAVYRSAAFGPLQDCYIAGITTVLDGQGERTQYILKQKTVLEEIGYVD